VGSWQLEDRIGPDSTGNPSAADRLPHEMKKPQALAVKELGEWRRRGSNENTENRNGESANDLGDSQSRVSTSGPRNGGTYRQQMAEKVENGFATSLQFIADRWPFLQPHIREAVITIIDCASRKGGTE